MVFHQSHTFLEKFGLVPECSLHQCSTASMSHPFPHQLDQERRAYTEMSSQGLAGA